MRIGCLQFAPKVGNVSNNIRRAEAVLSAANLDDLQHLDLLVLPEMAFSGYNFKSREHISPHVEPTGAGVSSQWACTAARKYNCTVAVGYPEKVDAQEPASDPEYYNSLIVVDGSGEKLANYRKSSLYYTDATWAREGQGFYGGRLGTLGQVAMGICMDINPYRFEAPWTAYEFAFHVLRVRANLVILSTAWLTNQERTAFLSARGVPDFSTLAYWIRRLEPVIQTHSHEETIVVFANRCGFEDEATYTGTSTVLGIKGGEVSLYGILGRGVEGLLVVDTNKSLGKIEIPAEAPIPGEPGAPPAPTEDSDEGPSKDTKPGNGSGYVDSPTLPSGFAPSTRTRTHAVSGGDFTTAGTASATESIIAPSTTPSAQVITEPNLLALPKRSSSHLRPKLSLRTNLSPPAPPLSSSSPPPAAAAAAAAATTINTKTPLAYTTNTQPISPPDYDDGVDDPEKRPPPSAIPIFVETYTPHEPTWRRRENESDDENPAVSFHMDALSVSSSRAQSPLPSPLGCGMTIHVAASPSIFVGGGLCV